MANREINKKLKLETKNNNKFELKGYNFLLNKILKLHKEEPVFINLIEYSKMASKQYILNTDLIESNLSRPAHIKVLNQKNLEGSFVKDYIIKEDVGEVVFRDLLNNKVKYGYNFLLYCLKCKLKKYKDLPYIGYTKNLKNRFRNHIMNSIGPHGEGCSYINLVPFHKSIIHAIELEQNLKKIRKKIEDISPYERTPIQNKDDLYCWLETNLNKPTYHQIMDFLISDILLMNFNLIILELHKKRRTVIKREKSYTKKMVHYVNNKKIVGTVWPNGLNAVIGGSGGLYIDVPMIDVVALSTLGLNLESISELLSRIYKRRINPDLISRRISAGEFKNFEGLQDTFLKPVVENLIKDDSNFRLGRDICKALNIPERTLLRRIKRWFNGASFEFLKALAKQGKLDWSKIDEYKKEFKKNLRGFPLTQWKKWAIEQISTIEIGSILGVCARTIQDTFREISYLLTGIEDCQLRDLRKNLRKKKAKELLQKGKDPKEIMTKVFKMKLCESNHRKVFEKLFKIPYDNIMEKYYKKS
jgi:predicted GIY-YIG superfamily endonuclease